tara:strand:+ start:1342 stop:2067 length:726 start_codon:yes stop_codon:yes gene_type:complete
MILKGKNVLITGATGGLGSSLAAAYYEKGCNLILTARDKNKLNDLKSQLEASSELSGTVVIDKCDFQNVNSVKELSKRIKNSVGRIDVLVNCAGIFTINAIDEVEIEDYQKCIDINLTAPIILIQEFIEEMKKNSWGRIINIASSSAYGAAPNTSVYSATKHALLGLSRSLYKELKPHGIRVICVSPGTIKTPMGKEVTKLGQDYDTFMDAEEVSRYIVFNTELNNHMISEEIRLNRVYTQ